MPKKTPTPTFTTDENGVRIALIPLSLNRGHAKINIEDYHNIQSKGYTGGWYLNIKPCTECVMVNGDNDNNQPVSRLIMNTGPGFIVKCRNNDRKDLRRSNLVVMTRKQSQKPEGMSHAGI